MVHYEMENAKCDHPECTYFDKQDVYIIPGREGNDRAFCPKHAKEVIANMRSDGYGTLDLR